MIVVAAVAVALITIVAAVAAAFVAAFVVVAVVVTNIVAVAVLVALRRDFAPVERCLFEESEMLRIVFRFEKSLFIFQLLEQNRLADLLPIELHQMGLPR